MSVTNEILRPTNGPAGNSDPLGTWWISRQDNWQVPPGFQYGTEVAPLQIAGGSPFGVEPSVAYNNTVLTRITSQHGSGDYYVADVGDGFKTVLKFPTPLSPNAILLADYRRTMYRTQYWIRNLTQSAGVIGNRLLVPPFGLDSLDDIIDPWFIIVKQAGRNAIYGLQTFLAGVGKIQVGGVTIDKSRATATLKDTSDQLDKEIVDDIQTRRWTNSPVALAVRPVCRSPWPYWGWVAQR